MRVGIAGVGIRRFGNEALDVAALRSVRSTGAYERDAVPRTARKNVVMARRMPPRFFVHAWFPSLYGSNVFMRLGAEWYTRAPMPNSITPAQGW